MSYLNEFYESELKEGEKVIAEASLGHCEDGSKILRVSYEGRISSLYLDHEDTIRNGESSEVCPITQRSLERLARTMRLPLNLISANPNGTNPNFVNFMKVLEARITDPEKNIRFAPQKS